MANNIVSPLLSERAVELLRRVQEQIRNTPRQLYMTHWFAHASRIGISDPDDEITLVDPRHDCGTTACIAGWLVATASEKPVEFEGETSTPLIVITHQGGCYVEELAAETLGVPYTIAQSLFYVNPITGLSGVGWPPMFSAEYKKLTSTKRFADWDHAAVADVVCRRIDHFIKYGE